MTISINHSVAIDLEVRDTRGPVHNFPADADTGHFVEVLISDDISVTVSTAADAQELEFRFAAARHYLIGEPVLAAIDLGDAGDDITDALVPDVDEPEHVLPPHTGAHVAWGSEAVNGRPFTWPQPFNEFHEYPPPPGGLDDAGDDITDPLVPDTAQPADIPHTECKAPAPTCTSYVCTLPPGHQGDHEAHGINCFAPPYETWPHTAGLPVPAEVAR